MVTVTNRSLRACVEPLRPDELLSLAEGTWSPEPDLNLENLQHWMAKGFRLITVGWWARYGPVQSGPAVYFLLQNAEGKQLPMWVVPGKKVAEFIRRHWQEWQRDGIPFVRIDFVEQPSQ